MIDEEVSLHEFDKEEWWDIIREAVRLCGGPPLTREQFEQDWDEFQEWKHRRTLQ